MAHNRHSTASLHIARQSIYWRSSTPYRRLTSSVRGAAGARFSSGTGHWAFSLGPVAELGLVSLNAHPVQRYFAQSHPYSVGLEAAVEFGR